MLSPSISLFSHSLLSKNMALLTTLKPTKIVFGSGELLSLVHASSRASFLIIRSKKSKTKKLKVLHQKLMNKPIPHQEILSKKVPQKREIHQEHKHDSICLIGCDAQ